MSRSTTIVPQILQVAQSVVERFLPSPSSAPPSELAHAASSDESLAAAVNIVQDSMRISLHTLPDDVLLLILSWLGPDDVVACKRTSRFLSRVIANDARLQYTLALAACGMVDGPPGGMDLNERAERFEAYRARTTPTRDPVFTHEENVWPRSDQPHVQVLACDRTVFYAAATAQAGGTGRQDVEIRSPGAAPRCLTLELREPAYLKAADVSQDLLVVGEAMESYPTVRLRMHMLSIETGRPHPAAAVPWIEVGCEHGTQTPVQILREKVVWQRCESSPHTRRDVEVCNWQTGNLVWRHTFRTQVSYGFLDDDHLIVTAYRQEEVLIYALQEQETVIADHEAPEPILTLELPLGAFRCAVHYDDRSRIHRSSYTAGLPFVPDPMLAVTAIRFSIYAPELSMALLLIPGSTVYKQLKIADEGGLRSPKVFWHEWGPEGALLLNMSSPGLIGRISFNTYGTRIAVIVRSSTGWLSPKALLDVVILELNPRAVRESLHTTPLQGSDHRRIAGDQAVQQLQFKTLRATVPHVSYVGPRLVLPDRHFPTMISMDSDGLMVLNEWEPPYQERVGFGYQAFTYMTAGDVQDIRKY
ncbi:hypothetical protein L226DRAFT_566347 [Lentinus tigrinus ALCF2SS1-7]|uniref:F-box domain-containing protein n=1 Tax=Lentinus tigrinus ALCF2SS1-6 TaxID=1328759 RepID=A0A5C2SRY0_9APHY|nr:hypothetical protein L227DRAFT_569785 [Lentinus tigrinus ALCF2SS1-6]RPD79777.1 hypothetical protein L226DRAFT_566347 [Lentinus tigrinus ALCF2SS1-7]